MIKNKFILKTVSLFLSFWMLLASTGLSVDYHYCEGKLVDWSLISGELECDHEKEKENQKSSCCKAIQEVPCHEGEAVNEDSNCCNSDEAHVVIENEFNISSEELEFSIPFIFLISFALQLEEPETDSELIAENQQKPPIPTNRKLASLQTFLL